VTRAGSNDEAILMSRDLIDAELLPALDRIPTLTFSDEMLAGLTAQMRTMLETQPLPQFEGEVEERQIRSPEGHDIRVMIHRPRGPAGPTRPAVLHMHGGGFILGSVRLMPAKTHQIAIEADCVVVSVDYRLAPGTRHPGPLEDCYVALKWLYDHAESLNVDRERIAVAGESAGGCLAAATALLARDRGEIRLIHQHLIYPALDDRTCTRAAQPSAGQVVWTLESNRFSWRALLGCEPGGEDVSRYAAPARAQDLAGLPSTYIHVGALDLFAEENIDYARRLLRAGVPTELHVFAGAYHGFDMAAEAEVTRKANATSMNALRRALHGGRPPEVRCQ
jgi:acetyl esterase/lipase